uniref:Anti-repressor n=3 Tax=unclassified Caudoviricetes TaxID=2788787 RepID=A0AAU8GE25_9CAUD
MNALMNAGEVQTMSRREIAELAGKRHDHVIRDIGNTLKALNLEQNQFLGFPRKSITC